MKTTFSASETSRRYLTILCLLGVVIPIVVTCFVTTRRAGVVIVPMIVGAPIGAAICIALIRRFPLMRRHDIVIDKSNVEGPCAAGMIVGPRQKLPLSAIDLSKSRRSFWRGSFLEARTGEKIVVNYFCFTADQMRAIKEVIREGQGQQAAAP